MTNNSDQSSQSTSPTDQVNETADALLGLANASSSNKEPDNSKSFHSSWNGQVDAHLPLLPRSGWQDRRAFLRVLVRAKRSLDIAEIDAYLN